MILLSAKDLVKHFGPEPVLDGTTFEIRPGDKVGLVGPNGAGKTTLLNILAGKLDADRGTVERHASATVEYLEQHPTIRHGHTLWEEAREALGDLVHMAHEAERVAAALAEASDAAEHRRLAQRYEHLQDLVNHHDAYNIDHRIERVLSGLGFDRASYTQAVETLSGGQQNRLLLAKLLLREPALMLLDEPSNHLDIAATEWLESFLAESSQAILVVSHDRYLLDKVTNKTLELVRGRVDEYVGNFSAYWRQRDERVKVQERTYEKQQEFIAKTEDFIRRNHYGQKSAQAEDRRKKLSRLELVDPPRTIAAPVMGFAKASRTGDIVLRVEHVSKSFDKPLFQDLTFDVERGTRWGILGPNGTGKTTLLRCILGNEKLDHGNVSFGAHVRTGYYDQLLSGIDPEAQVVESVRPPHREFNEFERRSLLARFGLEGDIVFQPVKSLSGGERSRAALAKLSSLEANFLMLDEPTNHLDLWACDALERSLVDFGGTVLFVSHDRFFLNRVADHVLVVEPGRFRVIEGNYETYQHLVRQGLAGEQSKEKADEAKRAADRARPAKSQSASEAKPKRRFPYRKVADLEKDIFEKEARIEELHASMVQPETARDGRLVRQMMEEVEANRQALATLYEHWEEACRLN